MSYLRIFNECKFSAALKRKLTASEKQLSTGFALLAMLHGVLGSAKTKLLFENLK